MIRLIVGIVTHVGPSMVRIKVSCCPSFPLVVSGHSFPVDTDLLQQSDIYMFFEDELANLVVFCLRFEGVVGGPCLCRGHSIDIETSNPEPEIFLIQLPNGVSKVGFFYFICISFVTAWIGCSLAPSTRPAVPTTWPRHRDPWIQRRPIQQWVPLPSAGRRYLELLRKFEERLRRP